MNEGKIIIKGAREHNLKGIDLTIPRNKLIVITGLSGSGKSSLAFDTIYAEGQRRYVESLSAYARQFLGQLKKPEIEYIEGLSPAVAIQQRTLAKNPRSTVATQTEIYDYLRLLFARVGKAHCHICRKPIVQQSIDQIVEKLMSLNDGTKLQILAPLVRGRKGEFTQVLSFARKEGFVRCRIDGKIYDLSSEIKLTKTKKHNIEIVVDRVIIKEGVRSRLADSCETAAKLGKGLVLVDIDGTEEIIFCEYLSCPDCGVNIEEISPRIFSFNSPYGACPRCSGLGVMCDIDPTLIIPDETRSVYDGAIVPIGLSEMWFNQLTRIAKKNGFSLDCPFCQLSVDQKELLLYGTKDSHYFRLRDGKQRYIGSYEGIIPNLRRRYKETNSDGVKRWIEGFMSSGLCPDCKGARLKPQSLSISIDNKSIYEICTFSISKTIAFFNTLKLSDKERLIATEILKEIQRRLGFLKDVGLDYLTLDRTSATLSGGEAQRIHLATQIGSGLIGVLYILDEPSIGLHQRDNKKLLHTLCQLRDIGNTVIVVEHDEATIRTADWIIDLGPGAGESGGAVVVSGTLKEVLQHKESLTGKYLSGKLKIPIPSKRRRPIPNKFLEIKGARAYNLKNITVRIPLGLFTCISGVSGSGKSTLINETLYPALRKYLYGTTVSSGKYDAIKGIEHINKVINIDQSPIGRTPRSNPATYTGVFTHIRTLFSLLPEAKLRGYKPGRFSFNLRGGRCEACEGDGIIKIEMHFLPDVYCPCEVCKGSRYNFETLEVRYKGINIASVLDMSINEGLILFKDIPQISHWLKTLVDVGCGYLKLGQSATTLSGGEAQRIKLAAELGRRCSGQTLYLLDEPTTGLHFHDIKKLIEIFFRLTEGGNTVVVIEHNLDVIKSADYIIDLGQDGGEKGGEVVASGSPEEIVNAKRSYTSQFLAQVLNK